MKTIKIKLDIDTTSAEQLQALNTLLFVIGGTPQEAAPEKTEGEEKPKKKKAKKVAPVQEVEEAETPEPKKETKKQDPEPTPAPAPKKAAKTEEAADVSEYTINDIRAKVTEKAPSNRDALKQKLDELGAKNVTTLDPSKFTEFMDFMNGL